MRILVVGINYAPECTGIAPYTTGLADGLAAQGNSVQVLTGIAHYPAWSVHEDFRDRRTYRGTAVAGSPSVTRLRHYVPSRPSMFRRLRMELSLARRVVLCRWGRPDVVIVTSPALLSASAVVLRARLRRRPVGVIVHDLYSRGVKETGAAPATVARLVGIIESWTMKLSSGTVVVHERFIDSLVGIGVTPTNLRVVRNWVHVNQEAQERRADVRDGLGWGADDIVVLHSGNMGVKQGLENVIDAARLAEERDSKIRFVLMGDGSRRADLERQARDVSRLQFVAPVAEEQYTSLLKAADLLLVNESPGIEEMAIPSKLTSYFACARPVIAAVGRQGLTSGEIARSGAGVVVDAGDPEALVAVAEQLAADPERIAVLGENGCSYASSMLDRSAAIAAYGQWCADLAASGQVLADQRKAWR